MISKVRIIKEECVYRIQEYDAAGVGGGWTYTYRDVSLSDDNKAKKVEFKTQKEAEDYVEKYYIVRLVKEYDVSGLKEEQA